LMRSKVRKGNKAPTTGKKNGTQEQSSKNKSTKPSSSAATSNTASTLTLPASKEIKKETTGDHHDDRDVWADRQRKGIAPASLNHRAGAGEAKPFGSSYYYAHNNPNAKGGYSDGLRMEDFTMNGPRLLSRGGQSSDNLTTSRSSSSLQTTESKEETTRIPQENVNTSSKSLRVSRKRTLAVSKYLWDDAGDSKGLATIRIDKLPAPSGGTGNMIDWKVVDIVNVKGELVPVDTDDSNGGDMGLLVQIETAGDVDYRLHIPRLYGQATDVETVIPKSGKRLLVRIRKKNSGGVFQKDSNMDAWPHPQKKAL